jgi:Short C-terminal domain
MQDLTPEARARLDAIAARHGVSPDAALALLRAMAVGRGVMAQFNHPELGGMGQWLRSGMVMVGDMFDAGLKLRVGALCSELAALLEEGGAPSAEAGSGHVPPRPADAWWPAELGAPASSGAQDGVRYAYFPASRRLAVQREGRVSLHDTGPHRIFGVSQQQGAGRLLVFSSDRGEVRLEDLPLVDAGAAGAPSQAPPQAPPPAPAAPAPAAADPLSLIERLAELRAKGVLTEEEFAAKKAELLGRL